MLKNPKKPKTYECEKCAYLSSNKKDYSRHLLTSKHLNQSEGYEMVIKNPKNPQSHQNTFIHECECGKVYKHFSGLWRHKKSCIVPNTNTPAQQGPEDLKNLTNMVIELVKSNADLQKQLIEERLTEQINQLKKENMHLQQRSHIGNAQTM